MEQRNRPVEMLSVCSPDGMLRPVRFRYEGEDHAVRTVQISEIVCKNEISYVGIEAIIYVCKAQIEELERLFELKYTVQTHRWVLFQVIY
ncbi:MAG: hypothetical protein VB055_07125 [Oscillospiraceae bacterium]|nr:hypothetical protein [Oscillospiraceae bacterium]